MTPSDLLALRYELEAFTIDFWHDVDFNGAKGAAALYLDDAVFSSSVRAYRGRAELDAFYGRRKNQAPRVLVHTLSNFRITVDSETIVRCHYMLGLFAADGVPVLPSRAAVMLATVEEVLLKDDDSWKYQSRHVHPVFRDDTATRG